MSYINIGTFKSPITVPKRRYVPDISFLMAVCELNYVRLLRLFPDMRTEPHHELRVATDRQDLGAVRFDVLEQSPYTNVLSITQPNNLWAPDWQISVRVYHDAQLVEVITCQTEPRIKPVNEYPNERMHQPDEKMQLNVFLGEWLRHCLEYGHAVEKVLAAR